MILWLRCHSIIIVEQMNIQQCLVRLEEDEAVASGLHKYTVESEPELDTAIHGQVTQTMIWP